MTSEIGTDPHGTGYWKDGNQHNIRFELVGVQLWARFRHTAEETWFYMDVFKR